MREILFLSLLGSTRAKLKCPKFAEPACVSFNSMIADCNGAFNATSVAQEDEFFGKEELDVDESMPVCDELIVCQCQNSTVMKVFDEVDLGFVCVKDEAEECDKPLKPTATTIFMIKFDTREAAENFRASPDWVSKWLVYFYIGWPLEVVMSNVGRSDVTFYVPVMMVTFDDDVVKDEMNQMVQGALADMGKEMIRRDAEEFNTVWENSDFHNFPGPSFCERGYGRRGFDENDEEICEDVHECVEGIHNCDGNQECVNTDGSFECKMTCEPDNMEWVNCLSLDPVYCANLSYAGEEWSVEALMLDDETCMTGSGCQCKKGFYLNDFDDCVDVKGCDLNICELHPEVCGEHGTCVGDTHEIECECKPGYEVPEYGEICEDVDECLLGFCLDVAHSECINTNGSYECDCLPGFEQIKAGTDVNFRCRNINECENDDTLCGDRPRRVCIDTPGSFICGCADGFFDYNGRCMDVDECRRNKHECAEYEECQNTHGSYECVCLPEFEGTNLCSDHCVDDPCNAEAEMGLICVDGVETFECVCPIGYKFIVDVGCVDIDECEFKCRNKNAICLNTDGSYKCECEVGFFMEDMGDDKIHCTNVDECHGSENDCDWKEDCKDTIGSYTCTCKGGFVEVNGQCVDVNECDEKVCGDKTTCMNTNGGYECQCAEGFEYLKSRFFGDLCLDINECKDGDACPSGQNCVNTFSSYECECNIGFTAVGEKCVDINECDDDMKSQCPHRSSCLNTNGSYTCICEDGYFMPTDKRECVNLDECADQKVDPVCEYTSGASCQDLAGSYQCSCPGNMEGTGNLGEPCSKKNTCSDELNEKQVDGDCDAEMCFQTCETVLNLIAEDIICMNNNVLSCHESRCECNDGLVRKSLHDPECVAPTDCECPGEGYSKMTTDNNSICVDVNECSEEVNPCGDHTECVNTQGSYECYCEDGFFPVKNPVMLKRGAKKGDDQICVDINECALDKHDCKGVCINTNGSYQCGCKEGFELNDDGDCVDIDECLQDTVCTADFQGCLNTEGTFECQCNAGFVSFNNTCVDINECEVATMNICHDDASCINTQGDYSCICPIGLDLQDDEKTCGDVNECELGIHVCSEFASCHNTVGTYECECNAGFVDGPNFTCVDINECAVNLDNCDPKASTCNNTHGGYECVCKAGFEQGVDGKKCHDIDECADPSLNNCATSSGALCVNYAGSFTCKCLAGDNAGTNEDPCSTCPEGSVHTDCMPTGDNCVNNCDKFNYNHFNVNNTCTDNNEATVCVPGCTCSKGYVKLKGPESKCVKYQKCPPPECPGENEHFERCTPDCEDTCDQQYKYCAEDCAPKCVCNEGYVRENGEEGARCIERRQCIVIDPPQECPEGEEKVTCLDSCFATCDDYRRGEKRTENCDPGQCIKQGCACPAGTVRKSADPSSPCVEPSECMALVNMKTVNLFLLAQQLPPRVSVDNKYSWQQLRALLGEVEKFDLDIDKFEIINIKILGTTYRKMQPVDEHVIMFQYLDEEIDSENFVAFEQHNYSRGDGVIVILENTSDWLIKPWLKDIKEAIDPHFPCYSRACDIESLGCHHRQNEEAGCAETDDQTCQAAIEDKHSSVFASLVQGIKRNDIDPLDACKTLQCKCKAGYVRNEKGECILNKDCFGGCPKHTRYVGDMSICEPTCDDPEGTKCREQLGITDENEFQLTDDEHIIPGCRCVNGFIKESNEPWAPCINRKHCIKEVPECPENSVWQEDAPFCFPFCDRPKFGAEQQAKCNSRRTGMCVCLPNFYKKNPSKKSPCVPIEQCYEQKCGPNEVFMEYPPRCFDDCRSFGYGLEKNSTQTNCLEGFDDGDFNPQCVCKPGLIRKQASDWKHYRKSPCVEPERICKKPKTDAVHICSKRKKLPFGVDKNDPTTWGPLLEGLSELLNLIVFAIGEDVSRSEANYNVVYRSVVTTHDDEANPVEQVAAERQQEAEQALAALASSDDDVVDIVTEDETVEFEEVIESINVSEEELAPPPPEPPATPTKCMGDQTYDSDLNGVFVSLFGDGVEIMKVITGRGSKNVDYWDPSYGVEGVDEIFHNQGDKVRLQCKLGYMNSVAKEFTGAECQCTDGVCSFVKSMPEWSCISEAEQQMPVWTGAKFNFIKDVHDDYVVLKARVSNYLPASNWTFDKLDLEAHPEYLDTSYWQSADFTMFVFCPFDVTFGGLTRGEGTMTFPDFYPAQHSADGRLWSFMSRSATRLGRDKDPSNSYFRGFIDRSNVVGEQGPLANVWVKGAKDEWTCETGVLPGHQPEAITKLVQYYSVFADGSFASLVNYLRTDAAKPTLEQLTSN